MGAALADKLVKTYGARVVMTGGLLLLAAAFTAVSQTVGDVPFVALAASLLAVGFAMAFVVTPATAALMASVPGRDIGVGSALNDTARQVGSALLIAVLGSLAKAVYSSQVALPAGLPPALADPAKDSVGGASAIAASTGGAMGDAVQGAAAGAFANATEIAMLAAAAVALVSAAIVTHLMPAQAETVEVAQIREGELVVIEAE